MKIGITGGIGSGKSYVCKYLKKRGIDIYDCDSAAKRLIRTSDVIHNSLISMVGNDVFVDGTLNKPVLAKFLLMSEDNAKKVNEIVHPEVARDFFSSGYKWMECAILFESGFDRFVDYKILVSAPEETRIKRVMVRDGLSYDGVLEWMNRQWSEERVRKMCDYEIINDGIADIEQQIDVLLLKINNLK